MAIARLGFSLEALQHANTIGLGQIDLSAGRPSCLAVEDKPLQLAVADETELRILPTAITNDFDRAMGFISEGAASEMAFTRARRREKLLIALLSLGVPCFEVLDSPMVQPAPELYGLREVTV
jgi:hypothetical protein